MTEEYIIKLKQSLPPRDAAWLNAAFLVSMPLIFVLFIVPRIIEFLASGKNIAISPDIGTGQLSLVLFLPTIATMLLVIPVIVFVEPQENFFAKLKLSNWNILQIPIAVAAAFFAFILCAMVTLAFTLLLNLAGIPPEPPMLIELAKKCSTGNFLLIAAAVMIAAPLTEELLFRRIIFGFLAPRLGLAAGIIATSVLFALVHDSPDQFPALFILGAGFQLIALAFDSLIPAIIMHSCFNSFAMLLLVAIRYGGLSGL